MQRAEVLFLTLIFFFSICACTKNPVHVMESPNKSTLSKLTADETGLSVNLVFGGDSIVSNIQIQLNENETDLLQDVKIVEAEHSFLSETWQTINGKNREVLNEYNVYDFNLQNAEGRNFTLEIRMYDEGFAWRFVFPEAVEKITENSAIHFSGDFTFWAYNGENHNVGPLKLSEYGKKVARNPVTLQTPSGKYLTLHEAAIFEHAPFVLSNTGNNTFLLNQEIESEEATKTSWRAFVLGENPGDLIESNLLVNLNEACKIDDHSWIKPGRAMWDWRVWGYTAADGFQYGLNTVSHKRFIDFAAKNNVQYLLIDADWYGPEFEDSSDPTSAREGVDIEECMALSLIHI